MILEQSLQNTRRSGRYKAARDADVAYDIGETKKQNEGMEIMKIGFIGLGTMGAFMAANLQKSQYKLVVTDIRRDAAKKHLENGAEWADSPKAVAEQCDVVFTSLPGPPDV
jgi:lactate dehydrogenase-like 2-hydroxyacid dehydrogenase